MNKKVFYILKRSVLNTSFLIAVFFRFGVVLHGACTENDAFYTLIDDVNKFRDYKLCRQRYDS